MLLNIFIEAIIDVSILPFGDQNSFYATLQFQPDQALVAVVAATIGAAVALAINWQIGHIIAKDAILKNPPAKFEAICRAFQFYGWPLLLLTWVPMGVFIPLAAGILGYSRWRSLLISTLSMLGFYIFQSV